MPVTARLSKAFYDQFGEQVTNELVEWFNAVDLTYRNDLRALNDTNFARFEAVLDARFAAADLRVEKRFAAAEIHLEKRFAQVDARFEQLETRFAQLEARFDTRLAQLETRWETRFSQIEVTVHRALVQQTRWMVGLWMTSMLGILAVLVTLLRQGG